MFTNGIGHESQVLLGRYMQTIQSQVKLQACANYTYTIPAKYNQSYIIMQIPVCACISVRAHVLTIEYSKKGNPPQIDWKYFLDAKRMTQQITNSKITERISQILAQLETLIIKKFQSIFSCTKGCWKGKYLKTRIVLKGLNWEREKCWKKKKSLINLFKLLSMCSNLKPNPFPKNAQHWPMYITYLKLHQNNSKN